MRPPLPLTAPLPTPHTPLLTLVRARAHTDTEHYLRRWRHRKTELYREVQLVRQDLGALTAMIEMEQKAFLGDLNRVAAMLQPNAPANIIGGGAAAADADAESSEGGEAYSAGSADSESDD